MDNLSLYTHINSLPANLKNEVRKFVAYLRSSSEKPFGKRATRQFGVLKGKITLSQDFDAPLEDFKDYM